MPRTHKLIFPWTILKGSTIAHWAIVDLKWPTTDSCHPRVTSSRFMSPGGDMKPILLRLDVTPGHPQRCASIPSPVVPTLKGSARLQHILVNGHIIGTNLLTKFHDDRKINVASRVKNAPHLGSLFFQAKVTIFKLIQDIIGTNLLTKFHEDQKINEKCPAPWRPCFQPTGIIFALVQDIIGMNLLTQFYEYQTINVASRVKNAPPLGSHVFQAKVTIFELIQDIIETNRLTKFQEDRKINVASRVLTRKNAPPPGGHVFQPTGIIFELVQDIIGMNLLTKFYEDQTTNVASRVKNAPPLGSHVIQAKVTIFELIQDIIETNLLTKFHEDRTINVASGVFTRQMLTAHDTRRTTDKRRSQKLTMSTLCSGELKRGVQN
ncbi:hypothetical protein DPMN_107645 [Dreissena polymorpha]|uniref:Uncharacterized protein n=1 Tax=Dreissena polymorpha TaxID=45954 RepID=A0A9D4K742_DREPO|nr:hypothetical protein DPMN_107645 [Dreissena polymorpha]